MLARVLLALSVLTAALAVDRSNFKTCDQSSFCQRNRAIVPKQSPFQVDVASIVVNPTSLSLDIHNVKNGAVLIATVSFYDGIVRFHVNDKNPKHPRHQVEGVLSENIAQQQIQTSKNTDRFEATWQQNKIVVTYNPLSIEVFKASTLIASINTQGLLQFEVHGEPSDTDAPNSWAELFKTHSDSKPYGPSSVGFDVTFHGSEHLYGIPEHADSFVLKQTTAGEGITGTDPYRLYNLDVFEYELDNPMALYGSIPFMISHTKAGTAGAFFLNSAEMWIDVTYDKSETSKAAQTHWMAESGVIDLFILIGPTPKRVFHQYAVLTGKTELPPLFSLAYHQCRWNYNDEADVATVHDKFDEFDIPLDVIWLDIEHTDGKRYFTWDSAKFPEPKKMIDQVSAKGRKMVTIIDPHIKRASGYHIHDEASRLGLYIKNKDNNDYDGWCWPGSSSWLDFLNPEIRSWYSDQFAYDKYGGSTPALYTWNDMNEPSVFNGPEVTMHKDAKHFGGWEHRDVHNIYGMWQQAATAEGIRRRSNGQERPFVLSRAFFAGSQRYGAIWTGDNTADWNHMRMSLPMLLSINVAGLPFSGADIGGFFNNPDKELLMRWYQVGAFQPFMRAHAHLDTKRREPYLFEKNEMLAIRDTIRVRYSYLPLWYNLFHEAATTGAPVMRPLWVEFPNDARVFNEQESYLVGSDLLVAPVLRPNTDTVNVYFPGAHPWYDVDTYATYQPGTDKVVSAPLQKIPVFQRGGSIISRKLRNRRSSSAMVNDPFTLIVALDAKQSAEGSLYVDDYHTYGYTKGAYLARSFAISKSGSTYSFTSAANGSGRYSTREWIERIIIAGFPSKPSSVSIGATSLAFGYNEQVRMLMIKKPIDNIATDFTMTISL